MAAEGVLLRTKALQDQSEEQRTLGRRGLQRLLPRVSPTGLKSKPLVPSGGQMEQRTQLPAALASLPGQSKPEPDPPPYTRPFTPSALNATSPQP